MQSTRISCRAEFFFFLSHLCSGFKPLMFCYDKLSPPHKYKSAHKYRSDEGKKYIKPESTFNQVPDTRSHRIFSLFQLSILEEFPNELLSQTVFPVKHLLTLPETLMFSLSSSTDIGGWEKPLPGIFL